MNKPKKMNLAYLPTPIVPLKAMSEEFNKEIYIKRDDLTGVEMSGNKVRKLEYAIQEALDLKCDTLITCGGLQSNHARATAAAAASLNLNCHLFLRNDFTDTKSGNAFLDLLFGATIHLIEPEDYVDIDGIMENFKNELIDQKGYILPTGASNGIGTFGYVDAVEEIRQSNIDFDAVVVTVGSGGTYAGLWYGNKINNEPYDIIGFNIASTKSYFQKRIVEILKESFSLCDDHRTVEEDDIQIIDGYGGRGYGLSTKEELDFIHEFAKKEGILLDPVYTGKAMFGLYNSLKQGMFNDYKEILFIHTGGLYGTFPKSSQFEF
ncbi:MAG: D-cysteine desulfhydrase family protein [Clostridia bacterium]|nr:D-cysteine desulfhydrase family protein [Clostridia bacterium]